MLKEPADWNDLQNALSNYGVKVFELPSLDTTLTSVIDLLNQQNQFLKDKQLLLDAFLDGYLINCDDNNIKSLIERHRMVIREIGFGDARLCYLVKAINVANDIVPYLNMPDNFRFIVKP
jgi:hypothetical protein